jgi:hypothetical protein
MELKIKIYQAKNLNDMKNRADFKVNEQHLHKVLEAKAYSYFYESLETLNRHTARVFGMAPKRITIDHYKQRQYDLNAMRKEDAETSQRIAAGLK